MRPVPLVLAAALLLLCGFATPAAAACVEATGPRTELPVEAGPCVAGIVPAGGQSALHWTVPNSGLWRILLEALPGSVGAVALVTADGNRTWEGDLSAAEGIVRSPDLFLAAGGHEIRLTTAADLMIYRLRLEAVGPPPPDLPAAATLAGAFAGTARGTDTRINFTWDLPEARPGELWTFEAQATDGSLSSFDLYSADGTLLLYTSSPDEGRVFRLPDLQLPAGRYQLIISGAGPGVPILLRAYPELRPPNFAFEPDDRADAAHAIVPGAIATGRLATNGTFAEGDHFVLDVPADIGFRRYDIILSAPADADLTLAMVDAERTVLLDRTDRRSVALRDLILGPGRHFIRVAGSLSADVTYSLVVEDGGPPATGIEVEPNNAATDATPLGNRTLIAGTFAGDDRDYVALGVTGGLQLWSIEVTGEGIARLSLEDGAGEIVAAATPEAGSPLIRMSRLLLPPGSNVIRIDGSAGSWLLRATPLGPPTGNAEIEPNDDPARALVLPAEIPQLGWLDRTGDPDLYAFHLDAPHRVALTIEAPTDFPVAMNISWGDRSNRIAQVTTGGADGAPQALSWQGLLPPGDYIVELRPVDGTSREPYSLALSFPSFFDRPLDLEPNDAPWRSQMVAAGLAIEGDLYGNEVDWFELDPAGGPVTIRADATDGYLFLRLARGDPAAAATVQDFYLYQPGEAVTLEVTPGARTFLQIGGTSGHYVLSFGEAPEPEILPVEARLAFDPVQVAAFEPVAQRITGTLRIESSAKEALTLSLRSWLSDERWRIEDLPEEVTIPPGGEVAYPLAVAILADVPDGIVLVEVGIMAGGSAAVSTRAEVSVATGVAPTAPHRFEPYPPQMMGGVNVAWSALGGTVDDAAMANLIDGIVDAAGVALRPDYQSVIRLAGDGRPIPVAGVILHLPPDNSPGERLAAFAIELSTDGTDFRRVLEATLSPSAREQAFAFPTPVDATLVRLVPISAHGGPDIRAPRLAEIEIIADPAFVLAAEGFDLALPVVGGHVVRAVGVGEQDLTGENALWPAAYGVPIYRDGAEAVEWVLGFLDGRAARITGIRWNEATDTPAEQRIREVEVLASVDGPLGPWTSLGIWRVADAADFPIADAPWIRSVRVRVVEPAAGRVWLPASIEVREAPGPSILGAWGDLARTGPFEAQQPAAPERPALAAVSTDPAAPTALALGTPAEGQVRRGSVEHWYAIELPEGTRTLRADFGARLTPDVALTLVADDGREVALQPDTRNPGTLVAEASPGSWRLRVSQPIASVAVTWDTSLSVSGYYPAIARMIRRIGWQLRPDREEINLLPFRGELSQFLMDAWSGDPAAIYAALHAYPLRDTSSDAENALLYAALRLNERVGSRAIVIATDASYSGVYLNEPLWRALEEGGIRVFALHFPVDYDSARARAQVNLMSDWAGAGGGHLARFASQGDGELAFRRLAAWLDQPADYGFVLAADTTPPEPGTLTVRLQAPGPGAGAAAPASTLMTMAIILDASGSMLQRLGDARRIDIAKDVLRDLGRSVLPEGMPVALRVFGHDQPGSCENALFLPLGPLDRDAFVAAVDRVQSVNLARTSIAATLAAAGRDLAAVDGPKTIVLVTDGEETCGGDPLAVIRDLRASGIDVRLNIIGFAIDAAETRRVFEEWATAGAGAYFDARDRDTLATAVTEATALPFVVLDGGGTEVARGAVGGAPIILPPGNYRLRVGDEAETREVPIRPGEAAEIVVGAP